MVTSSARLRDRSGAAERPVSFGVPARHLYVHVPFCARRCVYCDFSIAVRSTIPAREFVEGIDREWRVRLAGSRFELDTLYVGGGTPSKLGASSVARLMDVIRGRASLRDDAEVTLEANPEDVSAPNARAWRASGINRVSLGVQSFEDAALRWMHRTHDSSAATRAIQVLRDAGLDNISIDLIFALPAVLGRTWQRDLDAALELDLPHLSVYGLTVEPHTPLGRWVARRDLAEAPEESFEAEYLLAHHALTRSGLEHYEVSNYGKPGRHSRHNWAYWQRRAYAGLGPSAHEFDGVRRRWNTAPYGDWVSRVGRGEDPEAGAEELTAEQACSEESYLGLRTQAGQVLSAPEGEHVSPWIDAHWATLDQESRLRLTALGWLRLDALANDLTIYRSRY